jgi:hypothetical protein
MKQIISCDDKTILEDFLGKNITVFCCRYIYTGKLIKFDEASLVLEGCKIVYETGDFASNTWGDAQNLRTPVWQISLQSIESYGVLDKN